MPISEQLYGEFEAYLAGTAGAEAVARVEAELKEPGSDLNRWFGERHRFLKERKRRRGRMLMPTPLKGHPMYFENEYAVTPGLLAQFEACEVVAAGWSGPERVSAFLNDPQSELSRWFQWRGIIPTFREDDPEPESDTHELYPEESGDFHTCLMDVANPGCYCECEFRPVASRVEARVRAMDPATREIVREWFEATYRVSGRAEHVRRLSDETVRQVTEFVAGTADAATLDGFLAQFRDRESELHRWCHDVIRDRELLRYAGIGLESDVSRRVQEARRGREASERSAGTQAVVVVG